MEKPRVCRVWRLRRTPQGRGVQGSAGVKVGGPKHWGLLKQETHGRRCTTAGSVLVLAPSICRALSLLQAIWLVAVCACLDEPLTADAASCVRAMFRSVAAMRAAKQSPEDPDLPSSMSSAVSAYFGQVERP